MFRAAPGIVLQEGRSAFQRIGYQTREAFLNQVPRNLRQIGKRGVRYDVQPKRDKKSGAIQGRFADLSDVKLTFRANPVATAHETGGTFRSKGLMPIPIGKARTKAGKTVRRYRKKGGKSGLERSGDRIVFRRSRAGNLIAYRVVKRGKKTKLEPVAVMKKEVTLQAALGLMETWRGAEFIRRRNLKIAEQRVVSRMLKEVRRAA